MIDYVKAASKAYETLIKYNVCKAPVSPFPILDKLDNVDVVSFEELEKTSGVDPRSIGCGKCSDAFSMIQEAHGQQTYMVAYNNRLPFSILQRALSCELGHVILGHTERSESNEAEARFFAMHLICPRPLIHLMQVISMRLTEDLVANLTGVFHQEFIRIRHEPGVLIPARLNKFVGNQFLPFVLNFYEYYRDVAPKDGSALADFGHYMDFYEE